MGHKLRNFSFQGIPVIVVGEEDSLNLVKKEGIIAIVGYGRISFIQSEKFRTFSLGKYFKAKIGAAKSTIDASIDE